MRQQYQLDGQVLALVLRVPTLTLLHQNQDIRLVVLVYREGLGLLV
jgi:hypothetical protein